LIEDHGFFKALEEFVDTLFSNFLDEIFGG
jgi:hypothetical protein